MILGEFRAREEGIIVTARQEQISAELGIVGLAAVAGMAISAVDNFAFGGEISPIAVVALLLLATACVGLGWSKWRWAAVAAVWVWLPSAHVFKHLLNLPDTLHPNTYPSIAMLAGFSLFVSLIGLGVGALVRHAIIRADGRQ